MNEGHKSRRPAMPDAVKRQLRQESRFGCCRCGRPVFQYHHIIPWEEEEHFRPEDMMTLCPNCHDEATAGALDRAEQREWKQRPFNLRRGYAAGQLVARQRTLAVQVGASVLLNDGPILRVDGHALLALSAGRGNSIEVSLEVNDSDDNLMLLIDKNEWISGDTSAWDVEFRYQTITVRRRRGEIALGIDARGDLIRLRADFWKHGHHIELSERELMIDRGSFQNSWIGLGLVGLCFDIESNPTRVRVSPAAASAGPRQNEGVIVSPRADEDLSRTCRRVWRELTGKAKPDAPEWAQFDTPR